ncbi:hypothetical protein QA584_09185 [Anaerocolumna sp. AGMB13025]|uniref:SHOCT-like domain-containing protein n=1 Tax=Anaerocolumna sp. AGMB13025 TaxID=3039116 RepID=UPI00241D7B72|nr:hypothetical protein [Anaerocolumna sp. AGMB13025]WFR59239.1 hypothetical protein QA584_09185 [Anaerocolumna sp. AGMB13025]
MNEQLKILEMIEKGQITAAEGMELLEALGTASETETKSYLEPASGTVRRNYKFLKIKVTSENNTVNVNVNVPIRLLTTLGEIAGKMVVLVPSDTRRNMEQNGIDITSIDFVKIIEDLLNGTLDDPNIVDVEAWDEEHNTNVKVKIYVD